MKEITALNEVARHRPRSELVLGIQMENQQIRRLQAENRDLRMLIDEHQSAVDVIMTKYREQMAFIVAAKKINKNGNCQNAAFLDNALRRKRWKIEEMASVMRHAVDVDEGADEKSHDAVERLEHENKVMRQMLKVCANKIDVDDVAGGEKPPAPGAGGEADDDDDDDDDEDKEILTSVVTASFAGEPMAAIAVAVAAPPEPPALAMEDQLVGE